MKAAFYGGEWLLLRGSPGESKAVLQTATCTCAKAFNKYSIATSEFKRLKR
jgi:hypothetical protein